MRRLLLALPFAVAACGGGSGGGPGTTALPLSDDFDPDADVVAACDAPYYREIAGEYGGQIEYVADHPGDDDESCRWETALEITTGYTSDPQFRRFCDLTATMTAEPLEGGTPTCSAMDRTGDMTEPLKAATPDTWLAPPYPVDGTLSLLSGLNGQQAIYPVGTTIDRVSVIAWTFDGRGNATLPANGLEWSGVLVKE